MPSMTTSNPPDRTRVKSRVGSRAHDESLVAHQHRVKRYQARRRFPSEMFNVSELTACATPKDRRQNPMSNEALID
jgi:hypothetical protein